jgi:hypothetical protein
VNPYLEALRAKKTGEPVRGELTKPTKPTFGSFGCLPPTRIPEIEASNDPSLAALVATYGDGSAHGVDWAAWRLTTETSSPTWAVATGRGLTLLCTVEAIRKPRSYPQAWPVERVAPWPDVEDEAEEFEERAAIIEEGCKVSRAEAEQMAAEVIERARACWGCRNLRTTTNASNQLPLCVLGHPLVYRAAATRTWPGRLDARECGDRTQ